MDLSPSQLQILDLSSKSWKMTTTTDAYVARPPAPPALERVVYPAPGPRELLVDIVAASICHTDVRAAAGHFFLPPPLIIGHEGSGYVRAVGPDVSYVQPGDAVVLAFASCMRCRRCKRAQNAYCDDLFPLNFGGTRDDGSPVAKTAEAAGGGGAAVNGFFFGQSSLARVALVREESCVRVGLVSREELKMCAGLGCGIQTGAGAIMNVVKPPPGSSIVIFGGGAVGLAALLAAQLAEPACVVLVDNSPTKLATIPKSILQPSTRLHNSAGQSHDEVAAALRKLTPDGHGFDVALDCVGNSDVVKAGHAALDKMGLLVTIGSGADSNVAGYSLSQHLVKGICHRGTHQGDSVPRDMVPKLLALSREGQFPFQQLLSEFGFEDLEDALAEMARGAVIKPLLTTKI